MYKRIVSMGLLLAAVMGGASSVYAQECPGMPGIYDPAQGACHMPDGSSITVGPPASSGGGYYPSAGSAPKVVYLPTQYGAVVYNPKTGRWDSAFGLSSKRAALKEATRRCEGAHGENAPCNEVLLTYSNGCGAMAQGLFENGATSKLYTDAAETPKEAERLALKFCSDRGASDCKIIMPAECSLP
jgi:hypothetical protein